MTVTIRDVSKKSGYSVATVSRVINDSDLVTEETKKKVGQVIEELGFVPNNTARGLSTRKSFAIGMIVPNISNPFFGELIKGAEEAAGEKGFNIIILNSSYNNEKTIKDIMILKSRNVDGIIMSSADFDESIYNTLVENNIPFVLTGPVSSNHEINYVSIDNLEGAKKATEHLVKLGHKRIGYMAGDYASYLNKLRLQGYSETLKANNIKTDENLIFQENVEKNIIKLINMKPSERPTAIFTFNDYMALEYMEKLEEKGIKIPEDIAVVGFDNIKMASYYSIGLTTVDNRQEEFGRKSFELLLNIIKDKNEETHQIITKPKLIIRKTCGAKSKN
ncbi:MAG: LacI family DNA-binding transcriptional regulator [Bacillota bacterium]|nr:LacI family DNA-binding transcriptional regulator [Bacillota bacterium]